MSDSAERDFAIFTEALSLPEGERMAYLERACGGDEELRRRMDGLLGTHRRAADFLEASPHRPAPEIGPAIPGAEKPGDRIGRYKLIEPIGEGGCGVVYLAEQQEPVSRLVALKVIKPGMDSKSVIARFETERQTLALMDHPNIAKVLDAGATDAGRPYFVMEFIRGVKITDYCDQNSLGTEDRLKLFIQVCQAIQYAHQKGIIHRDIKPSNILVPTCLDSIAQPVVIDFGIAKATTNQPLADKTVFTAAEMLIGTPTYMSPEQASLTGVDVDTRTDIYSLGALLYELLTGSTPFNTGELLKAGLDEVRRVIREQEPARPSTRLSKMSPEDLAAIAQSRNAEPPGLIRSVRGDLDWIAMKALEKDRNRRYETANGLALDVKRFLARETVSAYPPSALYKFQKLASRNKLLFTAIAVVALLVVVGLVMVLALFAKERQARREAEADRAKSRQVTQFLEDMLEGVGPSVAHGRDTTILKEILAKTAARVDKELTNQPAVDLELNSLIGQVYFKLCDFPLAEKTGRAALAISLQQFGSNSPEFAASLNDLGKALELEGNLTNSENQHRAALSIRRRLFGNTNAAVAESINALANTYRMQHRFPEADVLAREALGIRQTLFGSNSLEAADSLRNLSILQTDEGRPAEAEETARKVLAIRQQRVSEDDVLLAYTLDDVAWAAGSNGKMEEAESLESQSLVLKRQALGDEHPDVARSLFLLGQRLQVRGKIPDAVAILSAALSIQRKLLGDDSPDTLYTLRNLSWALEKEGNLAEAEREGRLAFDSWSKIFGSESDQARSALGDVVRVLIAEKKLAEAEELLNRALTPAAVQNPLNVQLLNQRAHLLGRQGRWRAAAADASAVAKCQPTDHYLYHILATLLAATKDQAAYRTLCQEIQTNFPSTSNAYIAERMSKDCLILPNSGADLRWVEQMADAAVFHGKGDPSMPFFQTAKAFSEYRLGNFATAAEWSEKALNSSQVYEQAHAHAYAILAMAHWQLGEKEAAQAALASGNQLMPRMAGEPGPTDIGDGWVAWLMARVSLDEASDMIQPTPPEKSKTVKP